MASTATYTIRESARAKRVRLRITLRGELEVVVPKGFDHGRIPQIVTDKRPWIERTRANLLRQQRMLPERHFEALPSRLELRAIERAYDVRYPATPKRRSFVVELGDELRVTGVRGETGRSVEYLSRWLRNKAKATLVPWLRQTSEEAGLPFTGVSVRGQKTRWGSCSSAGAININFKLLFLPPAQVHYLFVHELCHTRHMNHSPHFWALVRQKLPGYAALDRQLHAAWRYVPYWLVE